MIVKLIKEISHPFGTCSIGTKGILEQEQYYVFPYLGKNRTEENGWLGNGYLIHKDWIDSLPDWFLKEEVYNENSEPTNY